MDFRFSTMPPERKQDMAALFDRWKKTGTGIDVLQEGLRILATPGRMERFRSLMADRSPRGSALLNITFTHALNYQAKGVLSTDDAQRVLDVIAEVRALVPEPATATKTVLERVVSTLFYGGQPQLPQDALSRQVTRVLLKVDPEAVQGRLF
ncbi:Uncharacterised protein [Candidatus Bilamarchaeum dharawalense]|uniref:Uncharacterized protein n=1 Tax=Candidatus Bilamarchaeum dharawalense TaxID=2885759 RepID=A0A5E4LWS9_9ARCH|nr:Uncharacterised protein [Candidatus Bilamarchaeum dharawalense]